MLYREGNWIVELHISRWAWFLPQIIHTNYFNSFSIFDYSVKISSFSILNAVKILIISYFLSIIKNSTVSLSFRTCFYSKTFRSSIYPKVHRPWYTHSSRRETITKRELNRFSGRGRHKTPNYSRHELFSLQISQLSSKGGRGPKVAATGHVPFEILVVARFRIISNNIQLDGWKTAPFYPWKKNRK